MNNNEVLIGCLRDAVMDYVSESMEGEIDLTKFGSSIEELVSKALDSHQAEFNSLSESDKQEVLVDAAWQVEEFLNVALFPYYEESPNLALVYRLRSMLRVSGFDAIAKVSNEIAEEILFFVYSGVEDGGTVSSLYEKLIREHSAALGKDKYPCFDYRIRSNTSLALVRILQDKSSPDKLTSERIKEAENLRFTNA